MSFKPMLACEADLSKLQFPLFVSPKLDGIRASVVDGKLLTRTLKEVPNRHVFSSLSYTSLNGLDGELIVGEPSAHDVYRTTVSGVMRHDGEPDYTYWVFDLHDHEADYAGRYKALKDDLRGANPRIKLLPSTLVHSHDDLMAYESRHVDVGYEGVILRSPSSPYKFGRSTAKEGYLLKLKRFKDSEAVILDVIEELHNGNEAQTNELGRTKRSSHKENKTGKQRMGALLVRDLTTGAEFNIGTGFNDADRQHYWLNDVRGQVIKYKYFPVGVKDLPRHPVFLGRRDKSDL